MGRDRGWSLVARTGLAGVLATGGRYPEAIEQLELAAAAASSEPERQSLAATGAVLMVLAGQVERAGEAAERAVEAGERLGNDQALCQGLQALAMVALAGGFIERAVSLADRAVVVAQRNEAAWANNPRLWHGTALADADRLDEADVVLQAGRREAERTGNVSRVPMYHWAIAEVRLAAGHWDDAVAEAQAGTGTDRGERHRGRRRLRPRHLRPCRLSTEGRWRGRTRRWTRPGAGWWLARSRSASSG